ncbi:Reverse transcriptase, RNA-dependent DNA polymerase domain-containing protein [Rozella allomycis CSF55]|uniref:Reverse transcriptase, RNA-dependent DNA polymerase domain-containing protein n=1 Tax=Rozella allomycis (strain CSF55) TaxID=988480 RepID=A0A075B0S6_ROZAC|nr:Reverse transcriptase, RNA-dependent DNA polymerase domain-containing protein [Rozella allomycis CSF55]|eukprot:EPZ36003.1 Reverse transcriptase, RNA-dependent DNA polymerase domain-containing protein [Rozella allomycis CSF55]
MSQDNIFPMEEHQDEIHSDAFQSLSDSDQASIYNVENLDNPNLINNNQTLNNPNFINSTPINTNVIQDPPRTSNVNQNSSEIHVDNILPPETKRFRKPINYHEALLAQADDDVPNDYKDIEGRHDASLWYQAVQNELSSIHENQTWSIQEAPPNRKIVKCRWVFRIKRHSDGSVARYKARLVAKGYSQVPGQDFSETYAPVAKYKSLRTMLSIAASRDYEIEQMDVVTAFLIPSLKEEVYMEIPSGVAHDNKSGMVCKLNKALYGLRQSPRVWYEELHTFLISIGLTPTIADPCLYTGLNCYLSIYVDDIIIAAPKDIASDIKKKISSRFQSTDLGPIQHCLGLKVQRNRIERRLYLSQSRLAEHLLKETKMENSRFVKTPLDPNVILKRENATIKAQINDIPYRSIIGTLHHLAMCTRPDLANAVGILSRFQEGPSTVHLTALKHVLQYLNATKHYGLKLGGSSLTLSGYADADWAGDLDSRRSTSGYCFFLGDACINWCSKLQASVALSSCEAEYVSLSLATQEAI